MADHESLSKGGRSGDREGRAASEVQEILSRYTHDEQRVILHNLETLAASAQYIGQDFAMKVLLNRPGGGWHWNFEKNEIRVDPETMLKASLDVSKAIYCHEGFHRRITPKDGVPMAEWKEPGLPFLVNSIEDPRIENFGGDAYPAYRPIRDASYRHHIEETSKAAEGSLGHKPRHIQAGLELIHQWFREAQGKSFEVPASLPPDVKRFVEQALPHAQDAWFRYPTRSEVDWEPEKIKLYFQDAYKIIRQNIWPEFKKLFEQDRQDQLLDEAMRGLQGKGAGEGSEGSSGGGPPQESQGPLTEEEARELLEAAKEGKLQMGDGDPSAGAARPLDLSKLSPELQKEIADFVQSLPKETKEKLQARGDDRLREASDAASSALEGKANQEERANESLGDPKTGSSAEPRGADTKEDFDGIDLSELRRHVTIPPEESARLREQFQHILNEDRGPYENTVREIAPTINQLENDLRAIFQRRRQSHRESGRRSGPTLNINRFVNERASGKPAVETRAFEAKTRPLEKDYAVLILVDVSGSMRDKVHHAFAATVACTEALTRLKIEHAIVGFNDNLYQYKKFGEKTNPATLGSIERDVHTQAARFNNDGWALQKAAKQILDAPERERILIVLSDGQPEPSTAYRGPEYDLKSTTTALESEGKIKLIGLGMGPGTEHVSEFFSNARANLPIEELPHALAEVIREAVGKD
jgi:Mg-chelatase subunit ChlD